MAQGSLTSDLRKRNRLLAAMSPGRWESARSLFRTDELVLGQMLDGDRAWFPISGVISVLATVEDGHSVEVSLAGNEGMAGVPSILNFGRHPWQYITQMDGEALSVPVNDLRALLNEAPALNGRLLRYAGALLVVVSQCAACNRFHPVEQRLARWLLMMLDRASSGSFTLTHEFIAMMVGAQRPSISVAASDLADRGLVSMRRGTVEVRDRRGLEAMACGCYLTIRDHLAQALR